ADSLINDLRRNVDKYQGTLTGYRYARQYAVALDAVGRKIDAVSLLRQQLLALPPEAHATADDFRLLLGLIAGPATDPGRQALTELLTSGSDQVKQRIALQLLGRIAAQPGPERETFRRLLDTLIAAPQPHPIIEDLLLFRGQMNLADKNYGLAQTDAETLMEKFPGSPLKPAALGVLMGVAWEQHRYRSAAAYATQARSALPPGEIHAQLGVLLAEAYFRAGDFPSAADAYAAVLNERPSGVNAGKLIFQRIQAEIEAGRLDTAQNLADQFTSDPAFDPESRWEAEWNLARALEANRQTEAALARVNRLLSATGAAGLSADLRVRMAWLQAHLAFEAGQSEQALKLAGALVDSLGGAGGAGVPDELKKQIASLELLQEAEANFKLQQPAAALGLLKRLRADYPQSDAAVYSYIVEANYDADNNHLAEAQAQLTKLADTAEADKNPAGSYAHYAPYALYLAALNAESLGQDANLEEADRFIERLVGKYSKSELVFYARLKQGDLLRKLNQFGPAQHAYEELVNNYAQHPDVLVAQMALADCHSAQAANDPAHAESAAAIYESLQDRPDAPVELRIEAGCKLGLAQKQRGQGARAEETWWRLADEFLRRENKPAVLSATGAYWMGRVLLELGDSLEQGQKLDQAREAWLLIQHYQLPGGALAQARLARYLPTEPKP
ncbi:MAG TPA: tetratricopeptide repeat protein, partial [Opitutaceae bacterium]|nr:tetratricopeptide repeat protein [Opitutaceae bacterium]